SRGTSSGVYAAAPSVTARRRATTAPVSRGRGAERLTSCGGADRRLLVETPLDRLPADVPEERLDVLLALGGLVVAHERVLPHIPGGLWLAPGRHAVLVQGDPVIGEAGRRRILEEDHPAHAAHLADGLEVGLPEVDRPERARQRLGDPRALRWARVRGLAQ